MGGVTLTGTTLEQLNTVLDAADEQYASFTLSTEWVVAGMSANTFTLKCDNCGGNHISPTCPQPCDEGKIARNRAAHGARDGGGGRGYNGKGGGGRVGGRSSQSAILVWFLDDPGTLVSDLYPTSQELVCTKSPKNNHDKIGPT